MMMWKSLQPSVIAQLVTSLVHGPAKLAPVPLKPSIEGGKAPLGQVKTSISS